MEKVMFNKLSMQEEKKMMEFIIGLVKLTDDEVNAWLEISEMTYELFNSMCEKFICYDCFEEFTKLANKYPGFLKRAADEIIAEIEDCEVPEITKE